MKDLLQIGRIVAAHGVKGEVTVFPLTDDPKRFSVLNDCFLISETDKKRIAIKATGARYSNAKVILKFENIEDRDQANALKGKIIEVTRENAVKLEPGSYFICDLIGCVVVDEETGELGVLNDVLQTGASDIYVVKRNGAKDLLIPAIKEVVKSVDIDNMVINVKLLEGLLDL